MKTVLTVYLNEVRFFAYHGLFEEEQKTGNEFEVNFAVSSDAVSELIV